MDSNTTLVTHRLNSLADSSLDCNIREYKPLSFMKVALFSSFLRGGPF